MFGPLLEVAISKKCTPVWREAHFEVKMLKTPHVRTTFGTHFEVKMLKTPHVRATFGRSGVVSWQAQGIVHLVKSEQNARVLWHF